MIWDQLPWYLCKSPLKPSEEEQKVFRTFAESRPGLGVVLGATPELVEGTNSIAVDQAAQRVKDCVRSIRGDWFDLPSWKWSFAIGDGILGSVEGKRGEDTAKDRAYALVKKLKEMKLQTLLRCYVRDKSYSETPRGINARKLWAWSAVATSDGHFCLRDAYEHADAQGWLEGDAREAFKPYRGNKTVFWLASEAELSEFGVVVPVPNTYEGSSKCRWLRF